jgi:hypothetical protein
MLQVRVLPGQPSFKREGMNLGGKPKGKVGKPCPYCGVTMTKPRSLNLGTSATRDHIRPKSMGGSRGAVANRIIVCKRCNQDKSDRFLTTWLHELRMKGDPRAEHVTRVVEELIAQSVRNLRVNADQDGRERETVSS